MNSEYVDILLWNDGLDKLVSISDINLQKDQLLVRWQLKLNKLPSRMKGRVGQLNNYRFPNITLYFSRYTYFKKEVYHFTKYKRMKDTLASQGLSFIFHLEHILGNALSPPLWRTRTRFGGKYSGSQSNRFVFAALSSTVSIIYLSDAYWDDGINYFKCCNGKIIRYKTNVLI